VDAAELEPASIDTAADLGDAGGPLLVDPDAADEVTIDSASLTDVASAESVGATALATKPGGFVAMMKPFLPWAVVVWLSGVLLMAGRL